MREKTAKLRTQGGPSAGTKPWPGELQAWIAEAAYYRAERRGFEPGHEAEDWHAAEAEIAQRLRAARSVI